MKFDVPCVIHEIPTKAEWKACYPENGFQAKLAYLAAKKVWIRNRLAEAQNWRCCWCTKLTVPEPNRKDSATIEHVVPRCKGGADDFGNYAMSCADCNNKRGTKPAELFMEIIEGRRVMEPIISRKQRRRARRAASKRRQAIVREMLRHGINHFAEGSPEHKMYERYKISEFLQSA